MTEEEYFQAVRLRWPSEHPSGPTAETIALCDAAIAEHPGSARLWTMRGDLIQLADYPGCYPLAEALASYERAVKVDPCYPNAYVELGYFFDAVMGKPRKAKQFFRKAWLLARREGLLSHEGRVEPAASAGRT